ncbi:4'-phosphopantetheinyl transferase family protein [Mycetocola reblochoni]|uniref:4'-phosphopantetheinyl transferase n=2 Tax=Mycetocola reblochoni TaxID=331618 RepID=A0A1R4IE14_9MICO|nr:4'-phosphopantetheinyl transferase superfamily protein [Mycetocola reblochoni]RLP69125.1 4'-phosphopantetheinyl transferase superfamily protein [Mycetocola reblochoni]SJN17533.1 4'-phosphopantetheinyl transferase [Mycetocola reblochoni REB411]
MPGQRTSAEGETSPEPTTRPSTRPRALAPPEAPTARVGIDRIDRIDGIDGVDVFLADLDAAAVTVTGTPCERAPAPLGHSLQEWALARTDVLSAEERHRAARLRLPALAARWSAAHVLLRILLSARTGVRPQDLRFATGEHGKPRIDGCGPHPPSFSLSHTGPHVLLAVATGGVELGVDIESAIGVAAARDVAAALHPRERAELDALGDAALPTATARAWTRTEAALKALGTGLSRDPSIDYLGTGPQPAQPSWLGAHGLVSDLPAPPSAARVRAAICVLPAPGENP